VGLQTGTEEHVHAVVVIEPGADLAAIVRAANAKLEGHQRIQSSSLWPEDALPRTEGTRKLKRREVQRWAVSGAAAGATTTAGATVESVLARFTDVHDLTADTTLGELGLSSLTQIEVLMALEEAFQVTLDEASFAAAKTIADIKRLVGAGAPPVAETDGHERTAVQSVQGPAMVFPTWARSRLAHVVRRASLPTWILPLMRPWVKLTVDGVEHLADVRAPVVFAANHQSLLDVPVILKALPSRWRYRVATAMAKEMFAPRLLGRTVNEQSWGTLGYTLSCLFFNAFPLPQREAGARETLRYIGQMTADGESILIFPEGQRTEQGEIAAFKPGVSMIASRLDLQVVPVRIEGLDRVLHTGWRWPVRGPVRVTFGAPLTLTGSDYSTLAGEVERAVRGL
jgi:1-acyl-sn-glycerol-3-phosphate acyltransferase/acyl carrier protein